MQAKGSPSRTVSIKTVAQEAGVSPATVSNALNGKPSVGPELVARVRAVAEALGYAADNHASRLRSGKRSLAGVVVPDLGNPIFGAFVSTLERAARRDGFDLLVVSCANDPAEEVERLRAIRSWRPAGLIVIPCDGALKARLPPGEVPPIVVADRIPDVADFDLIAVDNARSAGAVSAHLAAAGYRDCLVVGSSLGITNVAERWHGVREAAGSMAVALLEGGVFAEPMRRSLAARLDRPPRPDVIFSLDHQTSVVARHTLHDLGLRVPEDLGFASFDETEWMCLVSPPVTAVRQPVAEIAEAAWRQLRWRMAGNADPPIDLRLACAVALRGSTPRRRP